MRRNFIFVVGCLGVLVFGQGKSVFAGNSGQELTAKSFIVVKRDNGEILVSENAKDRHAPASTTKLLTAIVVAEHADFIDVVTVSRSAANCSPVRIGLKTGERFPLKDLLTAALVRSANDACVALAEHIGGTEEEFVNLMNAKAIQLGAMDSCFANPHGLSGGEQYTTAYDMLIIIDAFRQNDTLVELLRTQKASIVSLAGRELPVLSRNKILKQNSYDFFVGKTGYTQEAGKCFVGIAKKDQSEIIFALLGSQNHWEDVRTLLDWGFFLQ